MIDVMDNGKSRSEYNASNYVYRGKVISLRVDRLSNGRIREVVEHRGSVAILPLLDDNKIILERQYRYAIDKHLLEIPAGMVEANESIEDAAKRELLEETGYRAGRLDYIGRCYMTPGYCTEVIHFFVAKELENTEKYSRDDDEEIDLVVMGIDEAIGKIISNEIEDAKTAYALLFYYNISRNHWRTS